MGPFTAVFDGSVHCWSVVDLESAGPAASIESCRGVGSAPPRSNSCTNATRPCALRTARIAFCIFSHRNHELQSSGKIRTIYKCEHHQRCSKISESCGVRATIQHNSGACHRVLLQYVTTNAFLTRLGARTISCHFRRAAVPT